MNELPQRQNSATVWKNLDCFCGPVSPQMVRIFLQLDDQSPEDGYSLSGHVYGPHSQFAHTLPARVPIRDLGAGQGLMARVDLVDPCFWSAESPYLYAFHVELRKDGKTVSTVDFPWGFRWLSVEDGRLCQAGTRIVLRGMHAGATCVRDMVAWRETSAVRIVSSDQVDSLEEAGEQGVMIAVEMSGPLSEMVSPLRKLTRYPAVVMAIVDGKHDDLSALRKAVPSLLLGSRIESLEQAAVAGDVAICAAGDGPALLRARDRWGCPLIVERRLEAATSLPAARAACDRLQRDLTSWGLFAGYFV